MSVFYHGLNKTKNTFILCFHVVLLVIEMELVPEGKNFRLAQENELPEILDFLSEHLPESLKVGEYVCPHVLSAKHFLGFQKEYVLSLDP
jgi:hypothetical protein